MDSTDKKPILSVQEQIEHLKEKGVTFDLFSEMDASSYLMYNNYYFKLASYRKNYNKHIGGINKGKYIHLDFAYLRDLAIIDMELRYVLVHLSLNIEHHLKLQLIREVEGHLEDGYSVCREFLADLDDAQRDLLLKEISRNDKSIYCRDLFRKYPKDFPIWVFLELIPFGRAISFYRFISDRYSSLEMHSIYFLLRACQNARNASAHNSCMLNDLRLGTSEHSSHNYVLKELSKLGLPRKTIAKRMSNARVQTIITLLYTHNLFVSSDGIKRKSSIELHNFRNRMMKNFNYYEKNDLIASTFKFIEKVIDNWYPMV